MCEWLRIRALLCFSLVITPTTNTQSDVTECLRAEELKKQQWKSDAPQAVLRDKLFTRIFVSMGLSTQLLDNDDFREYHRTVDLKYNLPSKCMPLTLQ